MRVALDTRVLEHRELAEGGIGRYTACLLEALRDSHPGELVELRGLRRPPAPARLAEGWEHLLLGRDARRAGADVLHSPAQDLATARAGAPYVVTLHDLVPLKRREQQLRTGLKHRLRYRAARRATRTIVPSQAVAGDAERLLGLHPARMAVIPEAPAPWLGPVGDPRSHLGRLALPERFLVWVGTLDPPDPRKGLDALVAEVARGHGPPLVLAGRAGAGASRLAVPGRVLLAGRIEDSELGALLSAADALVFPSQDEGYGLPPVEALACGTPVAAYAAGALPEVLGGVAGTALVEPGDVRALLAAAETLAGAPVQRPARTWSDVATETWAVYEEAAQT
jgi:glycosyltransferase involved in cell wall biosynthesis